MAIDLKALARPSANRPVIVTLCADGGMGKTTLASYFPNPVFIRTEDGTMSLTGRDDVALFDLATSTSEVFAQIEALATQDHEFKTLVIDSITKLNAIVEQEIVDSDPKCKSINTALGGYGAGFKAVGRVHQQLREYCAYLSKEKNMNIVFIAHATTEKIDPPDGEAYTRYQLRLNQHSVAPYTDDVDAVAYIKQRRILKGDGDNKKAITTGDRVIVCYPTPANISKNRFGISEDINFTLGANPFEQFIHNNK